MKIIINNEDSIILYINKFYLENLDFKDRDELEIYFRNLFLKLKNYYDININGYYHIDVYLDNIYGIILEINKEDTEYVDYFDNQVDMEILIHNGCFLFKVKDYLDFRELTKDKFSFYTYKNNIYGLLKEKINPIYYGKLLELSDLVYKDETETIVHYGKILKT